MKPKILYIDDEYQNLVGFKASFREEFTIITASSAVEGLELLSNELANSIQVIISDQRMPIMKGDEFFTYVPETQRHATRILLTAFTDIDAAKQALNKGRISFFYNKPYDEDEFKKVLYQGCLLFNKKVELENEVEEIKNISKLQIQKLVTYYEKSRNTFSEELHEEFAQKLAGLKFFLGALESNKDSSNFSVLIKQINETLNESIINIREICFKMMPRSLEYGGLEDTLFELVKRSNETSNINLKLIKCDLPKLSIESNFFIYRFFEEILNSFFNSFTESIDLEITVKGNLLITFDSTSTIKKWKIAENLVSKIKAYDGKIIQKNNQLKVVFH